MSGTLVKAFRAPDKARMKVHEGGCKPSFDFPEMDCSPDGNEEYFRFEVNLHGGGQCWPLNEYGSLAWRFGGWSVGLCSYHQSADILRRDQPAGLEIANSQVAPLMRNVIPCAINPPDNRHCAQKYLSIPERHDSITFLPGFSAFCTVPPAPRHENGLLPVIAGVLN